MHLKQREVLAEDQSTREVPQKAAVSSQSYDHVDPPKNTFFEGDTNVIVPTVLWIGRVSVAIRRLVYLSCTEAA